MSVVRQGLVVAIAASTVAFASAAMAGKGGIPGGNALAPGQAGTSPGQVFKSERSVDPSALSPGQQFNQNRDALIPGTLPPGKTFATPGQPTR
jgi:hypothetical protein